MGTFVTGGDIIKSSGAFNPVLGAVANAPPDIEWVVEAQKIQIDEMNFASAFPTLGGRLLLSSK